MSAFSLRIPKALEDRLDLEARRSGVPRSAVARTALEFFLDRRERERLLAGFVAEARTTYGDAARRDELLALADEALPFDNEALEISEARPSRKAAGRAKARKRRR